MARRIDLQPVVAGRQVARQLEPAERIFRLVGNVIGGRKLFEPIECDFDAALVPVLEEDVDEPVAAGVAAVQSQLDRRNHPFPGDVNRLDGNPFSMKNKKINFL